jgi:hypothetical protein
MHRDGCSKPLASKRAKFILGVLNMKKILTILLFTISVTLFASEFKVRSFDFNQNDLSARRNPRTDANDENCAIIKVSCDIPNLNFDSNAGIVGEIEYKKGEYWVYVSPGEKEIDVFKEGYEKLSFFISANIKSNQVYLLKIYGTGINDLQADSNLLQITFQLNEKGVYISRDKLAPIKSNDKISVFELPSGIYNFRFQKNGFETVQKEIKLTADNTTKIEMVKGQTIDRLKLPGIVIINSEPSNAEVFINGKLVGVTPFLDELIAGDYKLMLKKKMYHSANLSFSLGEGVTKEISKITLKESFALLSLNSTPSNAVVFLNNKRVGKTPIQNKQLLSNTYHLKLQKDLYHDIDQNITLKDGDNTKLNFDFEPAFGKMIITSQPTDANVFIDGELVGKTPFTNKMQPSGKYNVKLEKQLWLGDEKTITIQDNQTTTQNFILTQHFGTITVETNNADIYIDDKFVGKNTVTKNLTPGKYELKAQKDKHYDDTQTIFLKTGDNQNITLNPKPKLGSITVLSKPIATKGAQIFINGIKQKKKTPAVLALLEDKYKITLKHPKFLDITKTVSLKENERKKIVFEMLTYKGSLLAKKNFYKKQALYGIITSAIMAGTGVYFDYSANSIYDKYFDSTSTDSATKNRTDYENKLKYRNISYYISVTPLIYTAYNYIRVWFVK